MPTDHARTPEEISFFRDLTPELFDRSSGNVESPCGWYGYVTIDHEMRLLMGLSPAFITRIPQTLPTDTTTYYVTIDCNGNAWAYVWGRDEYDSHLGQWARDERTYSDWFAECESEFA